MRFNPALIWAIVKREVRDQFRDWRITGPIIFLTAVFPFIIGYVSNQLVVFVQSYDAEIIAENMIPFFLLVVGFFPVTISLVIATESFVGEKERRSIEPLLTSPLEDSELYLGKLISVLVPPLFGSFIGMGVYLLGVYFEFGYLPSMDLIALAISLTIVQALLMVSAAVVVSTQATSVRSANLLASFIVVPMAFLIQWEAITMFWGDYKDLWWIAFGLVVLSTLFVRVGVSHFNREELLGQEFDTLNIRWMASLFWTSFVGEATSVKSWFSVEIPKVVRRMRMPIFVMGGVAIAAFGMGIWLANIYQVDPELIRFENGGLGIAQQSGLLGFVSGETAILLWLHNLRALLLNSVLGIFTFGVLGVLILVLPFVLIAFLMPPVVSAGIPAWKYLMAFVIPHGIFEIPEILLLGAAILSVGAGLVSSTKGESITDGLVRTLADWAKVVVGLVIPLSLLAALMEALVTPLVAVWLLS
ncbi:stage II sporulation protein M [bacterium]|nr:stage II sporulation protein M [bacterium]